MTCTPASVRVATVPAAPKSTSSGWAVTTSARSISGKVSTARAYDQLAPSVRSHGCPAMSHSAHSSSPIRSSGSRRDYRHAAFRALRAADELVFFDEWEYQDSPLPKGPGYWAVTRHDDVWAASRNPHVHQRPRRQHRRHPQEMNEFIGSMIAMDDPRHFRLRNIVAKGFTPEADHPGRGVRTHQGDGHHRSSARAIPGRRVRLRRAGRRAAPPADHLRDDGHTARATRHRSSSGPTSSSVSAIPSTSARSSSCSGC